MPATLGPDHPVPAIRKRLRCTRCGSNSCGVLNLVVLFYQVRPLA